VDFTKGVVVNGKKLFGAPAERAIAKARAAAEAQAAAAAAAAAAVAAAEAEEDAARAEAEAAAAVASRRLYRDATVLFLPLARRVDLGHLGAFPGDWSRLALDQSGSSPSHHGGGGAGAGGAVGHHAGYAADLGASLTLLREAAELGLADAQHALR
jgi:hypothetical protein